MSDLEKQLADLLQLRAKATPGEWSFIESNNSNLIHIETGEAAPVQGEQIATVNKGNRELRLANVALIVAAVNFLDSLPAWKKEVEREALERAAKLFSCENIPACSDTKNIGLRKHDEYPCVRCEWAAKIRALGQRPGEAERE